MEDLEIPDELGERILPLLPVVQRRHRWPARTRMDDRACLHGIVFVRATGIGGERLPQQLGYGSGMTWWRRRRDWQTAGVGDQLHPRRLAELRAAGRRDLARAVADSSHVRTRQGGRPPGQARSTAAGPAPRTTSWPTPAASRARSS